MTRKKVKKISVNKYSIKMIIGDKIVGHLSAVASNQLTFIFIGIKLDKKYWIIEEIEIEPEFRSKGLGTELLEFGIKYLQTRQKLPVLVVPVKTEYTGRLTNWYKRLGFVDSGKGYFTRE